MCIVYPRSGRTFQTAPVDTPKHDYFPELDALQFVGAGFGKY
jgi:hypothetical protein